MNYVFHGFYSDLKHKRNERARASNLKSTIINFIDKEIPALKKEAESINPDTWKAENLTPGSGERGTFEKLWPAFEDKVNKEKMSSINLVLDKNHQLLIPFIQKMVNESIFALAGVDSAIENNYEKIKKFEESTVLHDYSSSLIEMLEKPEETANMVRVAYTLKVLNKALKIALDNW